MENLDDQRRIERAIKKVKAIRGFYKHFAVYIIVNVILLAVEARYPDPGETFLSFQTFSTAIFWGLGLGLHAFSVFGTNVVFGPNWEDRKIRQLMDKDAGSKERWE